MIQYFEIEPLTFGFSGTFYDICDRFHMSGESLASALGFKNFNNMMYQLIFHDITDVAYAKRMNNFLKERKSVLRISCPMVDLRKDTRWMNDRANKKR